MQLTAVDLNLLVALEALLDTQSVKLAAQRLALSPSATSHALGRLRELLDDPLLVRAGRSLVLTPRANRLRPMTKQLVAAAESILREEKELVPAQLARNFTVAATDYTELLVALPLGQELARVAPGTNLYSVPIRERGIPQLRSGEVDCVLGVVGDVPDDIHSMQLWEDDLVCVLRAGHPAAKGKLSLERYVGLDHVLIAPRGVPTGIVDTVLASQGLSRRVARTVSHFLVAPTLIANTNLVLTVSGVLARRWAKQHQLVVRRPPLDIRGFHVQLHWHRRHDLDAAQRWLRGQILNVANEAPRSHGLVP